MTVQVHNAQEHIISKTGNPIWNHYVLTITLTMQQFAVYKKDIQITSLFSYDDFMHF